MNNQNFERLPFWHFFHRLEQELSYERWIEKYKLFLEGITELGLVASKRGIIPSGREQEFRQFCKFLYLQDIRDEKRFDDILTQAIDIEQQQWKRKFENLQAKNPDKPSVDPENSDKKDSNQNNLNKDNTDIEENPVTNSEQESTETNSSSSDDFEPVHFQYQPAFSFDQGQVNEQDLLAPRFLDHDEYFPLTRREMVKSWQYLRLKKKEGFQDQLDIPATINSIASKGMFYEPILKSKHSNREDTLIIFADTRGSMTPFEALTDRLIDTAQGEGGHPNAPVYFFHNFPTGYVFAKRNLSEPVKLNEALRTANVGVTYAIVISDAGAARGNTDLEQVQHRAKFTELFLETLQKYTAKVIWLNPMPSHRWVKTAAERIAYPPDTNNHQNSKPNVMLSVLDDNSFHFQTALHLLRLAGRSSNTQ